MEPNLYRYVIRKSLRHQLALSAVILVATTVALVPIELQRRIVNQAIGGRDLHALGVYCAGFFAAILLSGALKYGLTLYESWIGESLVRDFRAELFERVLASPAAVHAVSPGQLSSIMLAEVEELQIFFSQAFSAPLVAGLTFVAVTGYLVSMNPWLALIGLHPLQVWLIPKLQRRVNVLSRQRVTLLRDLSEHLHACARWTDRLTRGARAESEARRFRVQLDAIFTVRMRAYALKYAIKWIGNLLAKFPPFLLFLVGGWLIIARPGSFDLGSLVAFLAAFDRLNEPWQELLDYYQQREIAKVRYDQVTAYVDPESAPVGAARPEGRPGEAGARRGGRSC